jgi:hypothetical protein
MGKSRNAIQNNPHSNETNPVRIKLQNRIKLKERLDPTARDMNSADQRVQNYKFLAELRLRGIINNITSSNDLSFSQSVKHDYNQSDLSNTTRCQSQAEDVEECLQELVLNSLIQLTSDNTTCQIVLDDLKSYEVIKNNTKDIDAKIAFMMAEWPQIAESRVLNDSFSPLGYRNLLQIPTPASTQSPAGFNNPIHIMFSMILIALLIQIVRKHMVSERRSNFFNLVSDCIKATTINADVDASVCLDKYEKEPMIGKWTR